MHGAQSVSKAPSNILQFSVQSERAGEGWLGFIIPEPSLKAPKLWRACGTGWLPSPHKSVIFAGGFEAHKCLQPIQPLAHAKSRSG